MRLFERLILLSIFPVIFGFLDEVDARPSWLLWFLGGTAVFIIIHLIVERYRWQMVPAYSLFVIVLVFFVASTISAFSTPPLYLRIIGLLILLCLFGCAVALPTLFPIFKLPDPSGEYSVGTMMLDVADNEDVALQVWYPAKENGTKFAPYLESNSFPWDWLRLVRTRAYLDVPLAVDKQSYPVIIFNHGGGFIAAQNTVQMQEFASHGYITFSVSHRHDSTITIYANGDTNGRSFWQTWQEMKPVLADNNKAGETAHALRTDQRGASISLAEKKAIMQKIFDENKIALEVIHRRVDDTIVVLNYLEKLNDETPMHTLSNKLDLDRVGIIGHSNGGAVAVNVAMQDSRIKGVINMDGYLFGDIFNAGLNQPFMSMTKEGGQGRDDVVYAQAKSEAYSVTIQGANHFNFMDIYLWMPLVNRKYLGLIAPHRAVEIMNHYSLQFFEKHLSGKEAPLLKKASPSFPEVEFEVRQQ